MNKTTIALVAFFAGVIVVIIAMLGFAHLPPVIKARLTSFTMGSTSEKEVVSLFLLFLKQYIKDHPEIPNPSPYLSQWYSNALDLKCSLEEASYQHIYRDLNRFRSSHQKCTQSGECAATDPIISASQIELASRMPHIQTIEVGGDAPASDHFFHSMLGSTATWLPRMKIVVNALDEPRVLARKVTAEDLGQDDIFNYNPNTTLIERSKPGSVVRLFSKVCNRRGHVRAQLPQHAFFLSPTSFSVASSLIPIFSQSSIPDCFADILYPSDYFWRLESASKHGFNPENVSENSWTEKAAKVIWRGSTTGGNAVQSTDYLAFHRQKLLNFSSSLHVDNVEIDIKALRIIQCDPEVCARQESIFSKGDAVSYVDVAKSKYLVDIDGNSFSQRILPFLRYTKSLVLKLKLFEDWVTVLSKPFVHYIPAKMDLSDLKQMIEWARDNDDKSKGIAMEAHRFANQRLRQEDMTCYLSRLLLEYYQLTI